MNRLKIQISCEFATCKKIVLVQLYIRYRYISNENLSDKVNGRIDLCLHLVYILRCCFTAVACKFLVISNLVKIYTVYNCVASFSM